MVQQENGRLKLLKFASPIVIEDTAKHDRLLRDLAWQRITRELAQRMIWKILNDLNREIYNEPRHPTKSPKAAAGEITEEDSNLPTDDSGAAAAPQFHMEHESGRGGNDG